MNPRPKIKIKKISQSISHIDGNNSIGFVVATIVNAYSAYMCYYYPAAMALKELVN